jgi:hypothetical protein
MKKDITELFVFVDDFCNTAKQFLNKPSLGNDIKIKKPTRVPEMSDSEIMTVVLLYYKSPCKNFKYYYKSYAQLYKSEFPKLVSYERFVQIKSRILQYLSMLIDWLMHNTKLTGVSFVDSTPIKVCHNKRIKRNKVFKGLAKVGKSTMGWFYGFKLHLVINDIGQIHGLKLTEGNVDDRTPVPSMTQHLIGLLFGDKGYIKADLFAELYKRGLKLVTGIKKKMDNKLMPLIEKILLRKRSIIETVFDYLKNKFEIEHTRHRSVSNFAVHILSTLVSYSLKLTKPSIRYDFALND